MFSVKVSDVSLRAVPDPLDGSGVSTPPAARNQASFFKSAAPPERENMGARPNLSLVPEENVVDLDEWRAPISAPVREFICAHVNLRYAVPPKDRPAFDKLL